MLRIKKISWLTLVLAALVACTFLVSQESETKSIAISSAESISIGDSRSILVSEVIDLDFSFPANSPSSKIVEIGNNKETVSIFLIDSDAIIFLEGGNESVSQTSLPLSSMNGIYDLGFSYSEKSKIFEVSSGINSHVIHPLPDFQLNEIGFIKLGNIQDLNAQGTSIISGDVMPLLFAFGFVLSLAFIVRIRKEHIRKIGTLFINGSGKFRRNSFRTLGVCSLITGFAFLFFVDPTSPAGALIQTKVSLGDKGFVNTPLSDEKLKGRWLFTDSPDLQVGSKEYSSDLDVDFSFEVPKVGEFNRLLIYGPNQTLITNEKVKNLEISVTAKNRIRFKIPAGSGRNEWTSQALEPGIHRIRLNIENGQAVVMQVDEELVYAMATNLPYYILIDPNLFVGEYLAENLESGNVSWTIAASEQTPLRFGIDRLLGLLSALAIGLGGFLIAISMNVVSKSTNTKSELKSKASISFAGYTVLFLSLFGLVIWLGKLQPDRGLGWPRNTPFFLPEFRFSDFTQLFISAQYQDPYSVAGVSYPPFGLFVMDLMGFFSARQATILFLSAAMAVLIAVIWRTIDTRSDLDSKHKFVLTSLFAFSFPVLFAADRGNLDLVVIALVLASISLILNNGNSYMSGILFGIASAVKIYPLFLLPVLIYKKWDLKFILSTSVTFCTASIFGSLRYGLSLSEGVSSVILGSSGQSLSGDNATRWNTSLASLMSLITRFTYPEYEAGIWRLLSDPIAILTLIAAGFIGAGYLFRQNCSRSLVAIYWLAFVLLVLPSSPAYRTSILLIALLYIAFLGMEDVNYPKLFGVLIGICISPTVFWYFGSGATNTYSVVSPVALIFIVGLVFKDIGQQHSQDQRPELPSKAS